MENTWLGNAVILYLKICESARNGIGVGLIFIGLGVWLASEKCFLNNMSSWKVWICLIACYLVYCLEVRFVYGKHVLDDSSIFVSTPLVTVLLVELILRIRCPISREQSLQGRRLSRYLNYTHPVFSMTIGVLIDKYIGNHVLNFFVVLAMCLLVWLLTEKSKNQLIRKILP